MPESTDSGPRRAQVGERVEIRHVDDEPVRRRGFNESGVELPRVLIDVEVERIRRCRIDDLEIGMHHEELPDANRAAAKVEVVRCRFGWYWLRYGQCKRGAGEREPHLISGQ